MQFPRRPRVLAQTDLVQVEPYLVLEDGDVRGHAHRILQLFIDLMSNDNAGHFLAHGQMLADPADVAKSLTHRAIRPLAQLELKHDEVTVAILRQDVNRTHVSRVLDAVPAPSLDCAPWS